MVENDITRAARFWAKVDKNVPDGCWIWKASLKETGYGQFQFHLGIPGMMRAHRAAWILVHGGIPGGKNVLHSCDIRNCVNPAHLRTGSQKENIREMVAKGRGKVPGYKGSDHPSAKLSDVLIREIRNATGTLKEIGARFSIHFSTVSNIRSRKTWSHI